MVVALVIVRLEGASQFGAYALVLQFVVLFEWLADFGQTDIAVRNICQTPSNETTILGGLATLKVTQGLLLALLQPVLLLAMNYSAQIVLAGAAGSLSILCYAAVQVFRTRFKVDMLMERDIAAELGGLVVMLPLTWLSCRAGLGIVMLVLCYSISRLVFLLLAILFSRRDRRQRAQWVGQLAAKDLLRAALPLGVAGLLVALYDSLGTIVLSKLTPLDQVAQYAAAARFVFPVMIVVQALGSAFYPLLSVTWIASPPQFQRLQQSALELSLLIAGALFCGVFASADFLMGLMGQTAGAAPTVLKVMSLVVLGRAVTTAMSPLIVIANQQAKALWLAAVSILLQMAMLLLLVPRYGVLGAAIGYLIIELVVGAVPVSVIGQAAARVRVNWGVPIRLICCAGLTVAACAFVPLGHTLWSAPLGGVTFMGLVIASGTLSIRDLRLGLMNLVSARTGGAALLDRDPK
jgi:O-antigen/teichoic acid export membrane protein